ncbi:unnamed protein product [Closterium sp. NIES-64]|nr:unnamed protein product [Closterium sp. NIES-64]
MRPDEAFGLVYSWDNANTRDLRFEAWKQLAEEAGKPLPESLSLSPHSFTGKPLPDSPSSLRQLSTASPAHCIKSVLFWASDEPTIASLKDRLFELILLPTSSPHRCFFWASDEPTIASLKDRLSELYCRQLSKVRAPLEGVQEWLDALQKAGVPCAVATSIDRLTLLSALDRMKLLHHFQAFVTAEDDMGVDGSSIPLCCRQVTVSADSDTNGSSDVTIEGAKLVLEEPVLAGDVSIAGEKQVWQGEDEEDSWEMDAEAEVTIMRAVDKGTAPKPPPLSRTTGSVWAADQALAIYIPSRFFPTAASKFRRFVLRCCQPRAPPLRSRTWARGGTRTSFCFRSFAEFCFGEFPEEIRNYRDLVNSADMTSRMSGTSCLVCSCPELASALAHMGAGRDADEFLFPLFAEFFFGEYPVLEKIRSYRDQAARVRGVVCYVAMWYTNMSATNSAAILPPSLHSSPPHLPSGIPRRGLCRARWYTTWAPPTALPHPFIPPLPRFSHQVSQARAMPRKVVYHMGPTNSGKTHRALVRFKEASSGTYCGAAQAAGDGGMEGWREVWVEWMEVFDRVNADGVYCNLVTGQERRRCPSAHHTACTIEMANLSTPVDVAVIDEIQVCTFCTQGASPIRESVVCGVPNRRCHSRTTRHAPHGMHHTACTTIEMANLSTPVDVAAIDEIQMIRDDYRGWAWTRALLGVQAAEVYACGDPSVMP